MDTWQTRFTQARRFWTVAEALRDGPDFGNQAVSNAVLAVIAANDALCLHSGRSRLSGDSHTQAAEALEGALKGTPHEADAAKHADTRPTVESMRLRVY